MKVLLLNGSPRSHGCTYRALEEVQKVLNENAIKTEIFQIGNEPLAGCLACRKCKEIGQGFCFLNDKVNVFLKKLYQSDALVIGSPVYYAGMTGQLKCLLDRAFFASSGLAGKFAAAVVSCRRGGAVSVFDQINHYFTITQMPIISSSYWNQVHGSCYEDVEKDLEGLQTMRDLALNMAWMLKAKACAQEHDITFPEHEKKIYTNFIK